MKTCRRMLADRFGATAAEYAVILAVIGTVIVLAAILLGNSISTAMNRTSSCLSTQGGDCG